MMLFRKYPSEHASHIEFAARSDQDKPDEASHTEKATQSACSTRPESFLVMLFTCKAQDFSRKRRNDDPREDRSLDPSTQVSTVVDMGAQIVL